MKDTEIMCPACGVPMLNRQRVCDGRLVESHHIHGVGARAWGRKKEAMMFYYDYALHCFMIIGQNGVIPVVSEKERAEFEAALKRLGSESVVEDE